MTDDEFTPTGQRKLTDPKVMRALAHPVRLALLEALGDVGELTATEASEIVGESPSSCSFHLRQLAKYGFVEEAEHAGGGRRRPWRLRHVGMSFSDMHADEATVQAAIGLQQVLVERYLARARTGLATNRTLPDAWRESLGLKQMTLYVTAEEMRAFDRALLDLMMRHRERIADPALRPAGARAIELLAVAYPVDPGRSP